MRTTLALLLLLGLIMGFSTSEVLQAQVEVKTEEKKEVPKVEDKKKEEAKETAPPIVEFDQGKADLETLKAGSLKNEGEALLQFFKSRSVSDTDKKRIEDLIGKFGDEEFDTRETSSEEVIRFGVAAVGLLRQSERNGDVEITLRCQRCLNVIEKISTGILSQAVARQLARLKPEGTVEVLLGFLPMADDELISEEIRTTLSAVAMQNNVANPSLLKSLEDQNALRRGAAAEALSRGGDKSVRVKMKEHFGKETNSEVKMFIALSLVANGKDKTLVPEVIKLMPEIPGDRTYRAEEILYALAGETAPAVPSTNDAEGRKKARDVWLEWWKKNEEKVDLAKLDDREKLLGFTLIMEMDIRGIGGRIIEVGPDGKERWKITNLQFPSDAQVLPGNRVLIAEHNNNRVSERELNGKEIWSMQVNQPVNLQRLANGNTFVAGRSGLIEWDRDRKQVFTFNRPEYDVVSGRKLRTGEYLFLTQRGQLIRLDKEGKQVKTYNVGRINYWAGLDLMANGKVLITQFNAITEVDLTTGQTSNPITYQNASSCQKLPNGNVLVCGMNRLQVVELDRNAKTVWEYKATDANNRPWRATRR